MLAGVGSFLMSKESVTDVTPFQRLVDATFRRQLGRDRRGKLPRRFIVEEVIELCHEANWTAYSAYKSALRARRGAVDWSWRLPRTSGQKIVRLHMWSNKQGYAKALGLELSGLELMRIAEHGLLWEYNTYFCDPSEAVQVGDKLKAVNGSEDAAGLTELVKLGDSATSTEVVLEFWSASCKGVPRLDNAINEWWLWHGAPLNAAQSIAAGQFQVSLAAQRGMYGPGLYFAESVSKSDEYTDRGLASDSGDAESLRCLLLCRVSLGSPLYNDDRSPQGFELAQKVLSGAYGSILGDREACSGTHREFIVFDADAVYPNYAVYYRRERGE